MSQAESMVAGLAQTKTSPVLPHEFLVRGHLKIVLGSAEPITAGLVGDVNYANPLCEIYGAIRVGDWLFCIEKMSNLEEYYLGAFFKQAHYTFEALENPSPSQTRQNMLMAFVGTKILPILRPELFQQVREEYQGQDKIPIGFMTERLEQPYLFE